MRLTSAVSPSAPRSCSILSLSPLALGVVVPSLSPQSGALFTHIWPPNTTPRSCAPPANDVERNRSFLKPAAAVVANGARPLPKSTSRHHSLINIVIPSCCAPPCLRSMLYTGRHTRVRMHAGRRPTLEQTQDSNSIKDDMEAILDSEAGFAPKIRQICRET